MPAAGSGGHTPRAGLAATDGRARTGTRRGPRRATALTVGTPTATFGTAGGKSAVAIGMPAAGRRVDAGAAGLESATRRARRRATALPVGTRTATFGTAGGNGSVAIGMSAAGS